MQYMMVLNDEETYSGLAGCKLVEVVDGSDSDEEELRIKDLKYGDPVVADWEVMARTLFTFDDIPRGSAVVIAVISGEAEIENFEGMATQRRWERAVVVPGPITGD